MIADGLLAVCLACVAYFMKLDEDESSDSGRS
jgi:hypothetical protein